MTALRQKMIEDMQLSGLAVRTQEAYVLAVRQLAEYHGKPPDQMSEAELREYFLYLKNVKQVARSTSTLTLCGINPSTLSGQDFSTRKPWGKSGRFWN